MQFKITEVTRYVKTLFKQKYLKQIVYTIKLFTSFIYFPVKINKELG